MPFQAEIGQTDTPFVILVARYPVPWVLVLHRGPGVKEGRIDTFLFVAQA